MKDLEGVLPFQDIIFNTIPHLILDRKKLKKLSKNAIIIDLSSYPGEWIYFGKGIGYKGKFRFGIARQVAL